jgi:ribosome-binding protein aMBF1 (putative translation factor)
MSDDWTTVSKQARTGRPRGMGAPETGSDVVGSASYARSKGGLYKSGGSRPRSSGQNISAPGTQVEKKFNAGHNKQRDTNNVNARKLDDEDEDFHVSRVPRDVGLKIQQLRQEKNMSRSELAKAINEKESVLAGFENATAIMNFGLIGKIERVLGQQVRVGKKKQKKLSHQNE